MQAASHSPLSTSLDHRLGMSALLAQHLLKCLTRQPVPSPRFLLDVLVTVGQGDQGTRHFVDVMLLSSSTGQNQVMQLQFAVLQSGLEQLAGPSRHLLHCHWGQRGALKDKGEGLSRSPWFQTYAS